MAVSRHPAVLATQAGRILPLLILLVLGACGSLESPEITSFSTAKAIVTAGDATTLRAVFANGSGSVDHGVGPLDSGGSKGTGSLQADTTFTLTVSGKSDQHLSKSLTIKVVPAAEQPIITAPAAVTVGMVASASVPEQAGCSLNWTIAGGAFKGGQSAATGPEVSFSASAAGQVQLSCKATNAAGDASPAGTWEVLGADSPSQPVITAPAAITAGTEGAASVPVQDGATYIWTLNGGTLLTGASTHAITFRAGSQGYLQFSCVVVNAAGTESRQGLAITSIAVPLATPAVSAPDSVTAGQPGYTACIAPPEGLACAWAIDGGTITSGASTRTVTFTPGNAGAVQLTCVLTNAAGASSEPITARCAIVAPPQLPVIAAPDYISRGSAGNVASVPAQAGCTLSWTLTGGTLTGGDGTRQVTFSAGPSGFVMLSCTAANAAGTTTLAGTRLCTIVAVPLPPVITAPVHVTANQAGYTASIPAREGFSCAWGITGGTFTSDADKPTITFTPGAEGTVRLSCAVTDGYGMTSSAGTFPCTIAPAPEMTGITASASHKAGDTGTASVPQQTGCTYAWTLEGGTITGLSSGPTLAYTVAANTPLNLTCVVINAAGTRSAPATRSVPVTFTNADVLKDLGLNNPPDRKGADGRVLTDNDHPFGKAMGDTVNIQAIHEVHLIQEGATHSRLYDVLVPAYTLSPLPMAELGVTTSGGTFAYPVLADTDGNGKRALLHLCLPNGLGVANSTVNIYRTRGGSSRSGDVYASDVDLGHSFTLGTSATATFQNVREVYQKVDVASGDLDGDGVDEIVFTAGPRVHVVDLFNGSMRIVADMEFTPRGADDQQILRVECADLDHDGKAEIIISNGGREGYKTAELSILKLVTSSTFWTGVALKECLVAKPITVAGKNLRTAEVKAGDLDGDGAAEIVLAGLLDDRGENGTMVMHVTPTSGAWSAEFIPAYITDDLNSTLWRWDSTDPDWMVDRDRDAAVPPLALVDLDGDGTLEIASMDSILSYVPGTPATLGYAFTDDSKNLMAGPKEWCYSRDAGSPWANRQRDTAWFNQISVGRLTTDPDGRDEILLLSDKRVSLYRFYYDPQEKRMKQGDRIPIGDGSSNAWFLALVDLDNDSTDMQYVRHELIFSRPIILAALASPPYWGIEKENGDPIQNIGNSMTQFGRSVGTSVGASAKVGFSVGASLGAKATIPVISNGEVEAKVTATTSWDFSFETEAAYERSISYETYAGSDAVLFSAVPIDVYYYQIRTAGPGSKFKENQLLAIEKQRPALLQFTDVQYYNDHNGAYPDIDTTVFRHTIGRPFTYPTLDNARLMNLFEPQQFFLMEQVGSGIVPRGNLYNTMDYSTSLTAGVSVDYESEITQEFEASFAVVVGASNSGRYGFSLKTSTTLGEFISGSVGGLDPEFYTPENLFHWGVFSHLSAIGNGKYPLTYVKDGKTLYNFPFKVVNFWVNKL